MKLNVGFFEVPEWEKEYLIPKVTKYTATFSSGIIDKGHIPEKNDYNVLAVFTGSHIEKELLKELPKVQYIATMSTGYDHIDLKDTAGRKIVVSNVPSYGDVTVAEYAFGLLLSISRKIYSAFDRIRETGSFSTEGLRGFDLYGKTLGVIGVGRIGKHVIRIANGFGMRVIAYDAYTNPALEKELNFSYVPLEELLKTSDAITIHVPYLPSTHYLINQQNLSLIKKGCVLINTSRGAVVETLALIKGLKEGILGGVGIDVLEEEGPLKDELEFLLQGKSEEHNLKAIIQNHVLVDMDNVVMTPHNAFNTSEAIQRILDTTLENINGFMSGKPQNVVEK